MRVLTCSLCNSFYAGQEIIQEQITRVLLERLIVNRPHPWGLLITFIELIKVILWSRHIVFGFFLLSVLLLDLLGITFVVY